MLVAVLVVALADRTVGGGLVMVGDGAPPTAAVMLLTVGATVLRLAPEIVNVLSLPRLAVNPAALAAPARAVSAAARVVVPVTSVTSLSASPRAELLDASPEMLATIRFNVWLGIVRPLVGSLAA